LLALSRVVEHSKAVTGETLMMFDRNYDAHCDRGDRDIAVRNSPPHSIARVRLVPMRASRLPCVEEVVAPPASGVFSRCWDEDCTEERPSGIVPRLPRGETECFEPEHGEVRTTVLPPPLAASDI
jgi:hypothetical protein